MKEIIYNITQQTAGRVVVVSGLDEKLTKDNVLGIINKTQSQVLYTPVQAANMLSASYRDGTMTISLAGNVPSINKGDELLVKLYSDKEIDLSAFAKESTMLAESQAIQSAIQNIDLSSVEGKVDEVKQAVENIKLPEIDTTELAKQGENQEATNSAILSALNGVAASMYKGVPIVSQAGDATIAPNVWNVWGEVAALAITKGAEVSGVVNSYLIRFVAAEGCAITFDGFALQWYGGSVPTWNAGSTYEINIVDNLALWAEFAVA